MSSSQSRHRGLLLAAVAAIVALAVGALAVSTDDSGHEATAASTLPAPDPIDDSLASTPSASATTTSEVVPETPAAAKKRNPKKTQRKKQQQRTQATPAPTSTVALDPIAPPPDPRAPEESAHLGGIVIPKV